MLDFIEDKKFFNMALTIAIPVAMQNIINTGINFLDTIMVATLDSTAVAAAGACNNVFNFWNMFSFGIISGGMILCSQFYGSGNERALRKTFGLTLLVDFLAATLLFTPCFFATKAVVSFLTTDPSVIEKGVHYLHIVCAVYPIQAITLTTLLSLRSFGKVRITVVSSLVTLLINAFLNYGLINGHFGLPALGITGAAIATVICRIVEMIILVSYLFITNSILVKDLKDLIGFTEGGILELFFRTATITALDEFVYGLGTAFYMVAYGRLGATQLSAISIVMVFFDLMVVFFIGFGSACSVILGIELGKNNIDTAKKYAKYFIKVYFSLAVILDIVILIVKGPFESIYANLGADVIYYIDKCMIDILVLMFLGNFSYLFIVGILRSGGDVKVTIAIDLITCWCVGVPLAFLAVTVWKLPIHVAYAVVNIEEVLKTLFSYIRYRQDKWANNLVQNIS